MPWSYDLRILGYVLAIAEHGSISAAARTLHLSQPTLSRQLRELERRLGATLFTRTGRGLAPTMAGEALVRRARRVVAEADAVLDDVRLAEQGLAGRLTLAFAGSGINGPLGSAIQRFRRELPNVQLHLVEAFDDAELSAGVLDGSFDVAVQRLPLRNPAIATRIWTREPLTLFLPAGHPLAAVRGPADIAVLGETPLVMWPRDAAPRAYDEVMALCQRAGVVPRIAVHARTVQTMLALVAAGLGASVMADSYRVLRREGTVARPLRDTATTLHLVWRAQDANPILPRLRAILERMATRPRTP